MCMRIWLYKLCITFRSLSDVSYSDECRTKKSFSVCQEMLPLFRAVLKFCSTNRLFKVKFVAKLFTDDTSLFMRGFYANKATLDLSRYLTKIRVLAGHWKMNFNADSTEQVVLSCKRKKSIHPILKGAVKSKL